MNNYIIGPVDQRHNERMLEILASSSITADGLSVYFDKSPDLFAIPKMKYDHSRHLGLFENETLKGFGSIGYSDVLVDSRAETVFNFFNFYMLPEARGNRFMYQAADIFFKDIYKQSTLGYAITLKGNRVTNSVSKQPFPSIPYSRIIDTLVVKSIVFSFPKKSVSNYKVLKANEGHIPAIVKLLQDEYSKRLFGNIVTETNFLPSLNKKRNLKIEDYHLAVDGRGKIVGVCAAWDCSSFRRTTILNYSKKFWPDLLGYKLMSKIFPLASFPSKGGSFKELTITDYAVENRDPAIMNALLTSVYNENRRLGFHFMNWASCGSDDLLVAANGFWSTDTRSIIVFASTKEDRFHMKTPLPYIDIAFL